MHAPNDLTATHLPSSNHAVSLAAEEADAYRTHVKNYADQYRPVGPRELELVQSLADLTWRIKRIASLETAIYALGREQFKEEVEHREPAERPHLLELRTFLAYEKQLRNLQTQEVRLRRYSARDAAELKSLQAARQAEEETRLTEAAELYLAAKAASKSFNPADHGFEFSTSQIERFLQTGQAAAISTTPRQQKLPSDRSLTLYGSKTNLIEFSHRPKLLPSTTGTREVCLH